MIQISPSARQQIQTLMDQEVVREPALRIRLDGDARSPLARAYDIALVEREDREKTEIAVNVDDIRVFLNLDTSNLLSGAIVDWVQDNGSSGFKVEDPQAKQAAERPTPRADDLRLSGPLAQRVQSVFDDVINPGIAAHGGYVELVDADEDTVYLRMGGGCQGCAASAATLRMGIERMVREQVPEIENIVDVTDHSAGTNPYY